MRIIGLCGRKRSGKDTVANALRDHLGFTKFAFADALKDMTAELLNWPLDRVFSDDFKEEPVVTIKDPSVLYGEDTLVGRQILQRLGVAARNSLWANVWVDAVFQKIAKAQGASGYVISDVRFHNEAESILARGGLIIRLNRQDGSEPDNHESETTMPDNDPRYSLVVTAPKVEDAVYTVMDWVEEKCGLKHAAHPPISDADFPI